MSIVEVWRGGAKSEQLDEMGHLNVRFYVSIATEALMGFAQAMGLPGAFKPDAGATLVVRDHHIRFLREARVRAPLHVTAGVLSLDDTEARVLFVLWHSLTGEPCATFNTVVAHVTANEMRPFPWSAAARERAKALTCDLPDYAAPKSIPIGPVTSSANLSRADELNMDRIGAGAIRPADCDAFGRMQPEHFMGSIVSAIPQFGNGFRQAVIEATDPLPEKVGNAALEYRLLYLDWPTAGDLFVMRTGMLEIDKRGMNVIHWMLDPVSGKAWGSCQAYITTFDLIARKIMPVPEAAKAALDARLVRGVSL